MRAPTAEDPLMNLRGDAQLGVAAIRCTIKCQAAGDPWRAHARRLRARVPIDQHAGAELRR